MTDNAQPTTEAGRRAIEGFIVADYEDGPLYEDGQRGLILAIEAEARAEIAAKVRALTEALHIAEDALDILAERGVQFAPDGISIGHNSIARHALGRVRAALDADAPAEPCETCGGAGWVQETTADPLPSGEPGEPYPVQASCPECGGAASEPRSAEPEGLDALDRVLSELREEVGKARAKHAPMNSPHEGWAVIREELEPELWEHVIHDTGRSTEARHEALQVAAMGVRYILDLIDEPARLRGEQR